MCSSGQQVSVVPAQAPHSPWSAWDTWVFMTLWGRSSLPASTCSQSLGDRGPEMAFLTGLLGDRPITFKHCCPDVVQSRSHV